MLDQENIEQVFDLDAEEINDELKQEDGEEEAKPEVKESGPRHLTREEWVEQGRDPEKWRSEEVFKEVTQRIKETGRLNQKLQQERLAREEDNRRLTNVAFLQQQQITRLRADLESRRDDAIDVGDRTAVKAFDKQLRDLDTEESLIKEPQKQQLNIPPEVQEWNEENEWLTADHPLKPIANDVFAKAIEQGKTIAGALRLVDKELSKHIELDPVERAVTSAKKVASRSIVDSPSRAAVSRSDSAGLRMSDCTREEREMFNEFYKPSGVSEKEFLKSLAKAREGK